MWQTLLPDVALCEEVSGGIVTREIPGRGTCTFAARNFVAGDPILCEQALVVSAAGAAEWCKAGASVELYEALLWHERSRRHPPFDPCGHLGALVALRDLGPASCRSVLLTKCSAEAPSEAADEKRAVAVLRMMVSNGLLPQTAGCFSAKEYAQLRSVFSLNGFRFNGDLPEGHRLYDVGEVLFDNICRINHSCEPNAAFDLSWSAEHATVVNCVSALKPIREGDEVCISYLPMRLALPVEERCKQLQKHWGFQCDCARCLAELAMISPPAEGPHPAKVSNKPRTKIEESTEAVVENASSEEGMCWEDLRDPDLDQ